MMEKTESKDNTAFGIHCRGTAITDSRHNKASNVKAYRDLYGGYHTRVCGLFNREDSQLSWGADSLPHTIAFRNEVDTANRPRNSEFLDFAYSAVWGRYSAEFLN
jgi:hypothetical protein